MGNLIAMLVSALRKFFNVGFDKLRYVSNASMSLEQVWSPIAMAGRQNSRHPKGWKRDLHDHVKLNLQLWMYHMYQCIMIRYLICVFCWRMFLFQAFKDCCTTVFCKNCGISCTASLLLVRKFWSVCRYVGVGSCWCTIIPFARKYDEIFVVLRAFSTLF